MRPSAAARPTGLRERLDALLCDELPASASDGGAIRPGADADLDNLRAAGSTARTYLAALETSERERTGIRSLRVGYNRVFGYFIEVPNAHRDRVPDDYSRKQTLAGAERFVTPDLKEHEAIVLHARERAIAREQELLAGAAADVAIDARSLADAAAAAATLDVAQSLATVAEEEHWVRPAIDASSTLRIIGGRHPLVERTLGPGRFVPNDVHLDDEARIVVLTGPNMAGKSTYLRQTASIVLLAQIGSYVPAAEATIGVCDRIFTRIGAHDDLSGGLSTFMVEMAETAAILRQATERSLVILDEIGRGTSTYDGVSIAQAVVEYLHDAPQLNCRTLFATHFHELTVLADPPAAGAQRARRGGGGGRRHHVPPSHRPGRRRSFVRRPCRQARRHPGWRPGARAPAARRAGARAAACRQRGARLRPADPLDQRSSAQPGDDRARLARPRRHDADRGAQQARRAPRPSVDVIAAAPIRRLPQVVADAIAAGEVIERPASVLKELVENALDAGARRIDIAIEGGGLVRIAVVDDGSGIAEDDLELAVERHATSKIAVAGDIARVRTLGFRGEALASIAAVSELRLTTRTRGAVGGATLHVRNGEVLSRAAAASGPGTRVEVCELFAASPARLRFLRSVATEASAAVRVAADLAITHPDVAFTCTNDGRVVLRTTGGTLRDAIRCGHRPARRAGSARRGRTRDDRRRRGDLIAARAPRVAQRARAHRQPPPGAQPGAARRRRRVVSRADPRRPPRLRRRHRGGARGHARRQRAPRQT